MGPFTTNEKGKFQIDHADEAVRGALVLEEGKLMWPAPPPKVHLFEPRSERVSSKQR